MNRVLVVDKVEVLALQERIGRMYDIDVSHLENADIADIADIATNSPRV